MKFYLRFVLMTALVCFPKLSARAQQSRILYQSQDYSIFSDQVTQGKYTATALSAQQLTSDYQSPKNESVASLIEFKFSINGKDNEMPAGSNHFFNLNDNQTQTPVILFGTPLAATNRNQTEIASNRPLKIRLDLRKVWSEIKKTGYFTTFKGDRIFVTDFKHIYIAGATAPLSWDFDNLHQKSELELKDPDGDGIYETTLIFNSKKDQKTTQGSWIMSRNTSAFPQYQSGAVLADAVYNLALEEMMNAVEADSTFRTGKEWAGVWTRDISYSIILSMAYLQPKVAMNSLMRKVNGSKRIIQDTGTGGAYPISTDRMIWATAAFEVYKATADKKWLETIYTIVKNSINDDLSVAYEPETGLVRGESSFLDWREQTYPKWMQPADIYESQNLGTNAVHYQANKVLAEMARLLNHEAVAKQHLAIAEQIKKGINTYLWMPEKGYYSQYRYGRNFKMISPRAEALGEALCIIFGIADASRAQQITASVPQTAFGISCIYPQIPEIPPYHNDAVWPFVQSYWAMAAAKSGNSAAVIESIAAVYRSAALFLTNKENFVAENGDFAGTVINSSNMLWSLSGNLALVHKILFGVEFQADRLLFHPFVPKELSGNRKLTNFKYQNAILDIEVVGYGDQMREFTIDGRKSEAQFTSNLKGKHAIRMILNDQLPVTKINKKVNYFSPATPLVSLESSALSWPTVKNAVVYQIVKNGKVIDQTVSNSFNISSKQYAEYQVLAVDANGVASFASEPIARLEAAPQQIEMETFAVQANYNYPGFSGAGFVETAKTVNSSLNFRVTISETGTYAIDFKYANGNGPVNTENKCAVRSLKENENFIGTFVFPQRGVQEWSNWGWSNSVQLSLEKGTHTFSLSLDVKNENMNGAVNQAMLDVVRITKIN